MDYMTYIILGSIFTILFIVGEVCVTVKQIANENYDFIIDILALLIFIGWRKVEKKKVKWKNVKKACLLTAKDWLDFGPEATTEWIEERLTFHEKEVNNSGS